MKSNKTKKTSQPSGTTDRVRSVNPLIQKIEETARLKVFAIIRRRLDYLMGKDLAASDLAMEALERDTLIAMSYQSVVYQGAPSQTLAQAVALLVSNSYAAKDERHTTAKALTARVQIGALQDALNRLAELRNQMQSFEEQIVSEIADMEAQAATEEAYDAFRHGGDRQLAADAASLEEDK